MPSKSYQRTELHRLPRGLAVMLLQIEENALMRQPLPTCHVTQSSLAWDRMGGRGSFVRIRCFVFV